MTDGFLVSESLLQELAELKRQVQILVDEGRQTQPGRAIIRHHLAYIGGTAITAGDHTTTAAGSGTVTLKKLDGSGNMVTITDANGSDVTKTVYNWTETASGTSTYCWIGQDNLGTWWFLNEAC